MRFEARELKPYAEPVSTEQLVEGRTYFGVIFIDEYGLVPILEPKVYIGRNLEPGDTNFQDFASYKRGVRFESGHEDEYAEFDTGAENHVFEYERALDLLMACALRRQKTPNKG
jgi:hypothetical protein